MAHVKARLWLYIATLRLFSKNSFVLFKNPFSLLNAMNTIFYK